MKLTKKLYESTKDIWDTYYKHPFVVGLSNGSLDIDKFKFFMIQDYLYLLEYAKVFALGVAKATSEKNMRKFSSVLNSVLNEEMEIHKSYMKRLGIKESDIENAKPSIVNTSYTNYMLQIGYSKGELEILVSILACSWSYKEIGERLSKDKSMLDHKLYGEWIKGYSSDEYIKSNEEIMELVDELGKDITEEHFDVLKDIFINCSRYEYMFWDMSYKKEMFYIC
ncbi:MAG: thiaminase II [Tyzzerella sp.]|uniref:Aminopyrimidine aminohydrolase n=1 Tax=Candidatus Fimicola merdigallinarum TaxID=2840819 RepID=A0A9D9DU98_9FIRM|nr:thiaminase II [Candidatus Fimicola merdigallinarum]